MDRILELLEIQTDYGLHYAIHFHLRIFAPGSASGPSDALLFDLSLMQIYLRAFRVASSPGICGGG